MTSPEAPCRAVPRRAASIDPAQRLAGEAELQATEDQLNDQAQRLQEAWRQISGQAGMRNLRTDGRGGRW